jgi:UDP-2,3-diacylglucosamine pyrophosphatase LpxH
MGATFRLEHANIMAYVTSRSYGAPRVRRRDLAEFLDAFKNEPKKWLVALNGFDYQIERIAEVASHASSRLHKIRSSDDTEIIYGSTVEKVLEELRSEFSVFPLFALAVGGLRYQSQVVQDLLESFVEGVLIIISEHGTTGRNFEVLDTVPAFSVALHAVPEWPGFVFWTANGASTFVSTIDDEDLQGLLCELVGATAGINPYHNMAAIDAVLRRWAAKRPTRFRRLLHLSDLHFGTTDATLNQPLLEAELRDIVKSVDRVVITGDLFDTPSKNYATLFNTFRNNITHLAGGREPISITGNHDQRMIGLFGDNYKQVALIGSTKVVVDDNCQMVFICFNSSVKGSFARGKITASQFKQVGAEYRTLTVARPELKNYLAIVMVHHHPFSFDVPPATWVQRALSTFGIRDESLLEMVDAQSLHHWCLDWKVRTILHGHKHKARYVEREVARDNDRMSLTAIGCGSSLGAEGSPVSYNMLEWDPQSQRWVASFFESVNGGAFREIVTSLSPEHVKRD